MSWPIILEKILTGMVVRGMEKASRRIIPLPFIPLTMIPLTPLFILTQAARPRRPSILHLTGLLVILRSGLAVPSCATGALAKVEVLAKGSQE